MTTHQRWTSSDQSLRDAITRIAGLVTLILLAACGGEPDSSTDSATTTTDPATATAAAPPEVQFDLGMSATWGDLMGAVASPSELGCVDQVLDDEELPEDLLDLAVRGDGGLAQWPVWSNVYFGVLDDDTLHWPAALWECLSPAARTAALLSASVTDFEQLGIGGTAEFQECMKSLLEDSSFVSEAAATLVTGASFEPDERLDQHLTAIGERLGFEVGTCLEEADGAVAADPGDDGGVEGDAESAAAAALAETGELPPDEIYGRIAASIPLVETGSSIGSGILIDGGYVVTNYHVVWPYGSAWLVFPDGTEYTDVPVVGWDEFADLAVLGPDRDRGPAAGAVQWRGHVAGQRPVPHRLSSRGRSLPRAVDHQRRSLPVPPLGHL